MIRRDSSGTKGMCRLYRKQGIAYDPDKVVWFYTEDRKTHPYEQMCHMAKMRCEHFFDSVVSYNDQIALEVIRALEDEGLKVPDDVSVTGYDDSYLASSGKSAAYHGGASAGKIR